MRNDKLNKYILHYLEEDITKSAIMLTGGWGTGKSHYINTDLTEYLDNKGYQCIIVSLYGMKSVDEISKSIFLDLLTIKLKLEKKIKNLGAVAAKTLIRNYAKQKDILLPDMEKDLNKLYKFLNLKSKLVVLEDVERTEIDLFQLLGYVNNLTEHDNAKVLLVANEEEILGKKVAKEAYADNSDADQGVVLRTNEKKPRYEYSEKAQKYLTQKEKTISDTIEFEGDQEKAICDILKSFQNDKLEIFCSGEHVKSILAVMHMIQNFNLRAFIFACQKTVDIYKKIEFGEAEDFYQCIFYSVLAYSLRIKKGNKLKWDDAHCYSFNLGISRYPLFRVFYDYIWCHELDEDELNEAHEQLEKLRLYDKSNANKDEDVRLISNYYIYYESDVVKAVNSIVDKLKAIGTISFCDYGRVAAYLIKIKHELGIDITDAKKFLVDNLKGRGREIEADSLFTVTLRDEPEAIQKEYDEIRKAMYEALRVNEPIPNFAYLPSQSRIFNDYVQKNKIRFHGMEKFAAVLDIERLIKMFTDSSPEEMQIIRTVFDNMYRMENLRAFFRADKPYLEKLKQGIDTYLESGKGDKIQGMQAERFAKDLEEYIQKLDGTYG